MSKRENDGEINRKSKHHKPNDINPNDIAVVAAVQRDEIPSPIFKLNAICCDDLFEWLSLVDLHSLGQTCKRMHQLTGLYFQANFKELRGFNDQSISYGRIKLNGFIKFVQRIRVHGENLENFQYIANNCDSLREFAYVGNRFPAAIDAMKVKLEKINSVAFISLTAPLFRYYEDFLKLCPNLKILRFKNFFSLKSEFLCHKYPKLQHFMFYDQPSEILNKNLEIFFQKNTQLRTFDTEHTIILENSEKFIKSNVKLDILHIRFDIRTEIHDNFHMILNELYENDCYKRLELRFDRLSATQRAQIDNIGRFPGLEKLSLVGLDEIIHFPLIENLKELCITSTHMDFEAMIVSFPNLSRIFFGMISMDQLQLFIQRLPKLREIHIREWCSNQLFIDLSELNNKRKKLAGACKVTMHIEESIYLETKGAPINLYTNHNLIEIKRFGSSDIYNYFGNY